MGGLFHITWESEMRVAAYLAYLAGKCEIGADHWGPFTRDGSPIVQLITGPGPNATCEIAHYVQDFEYFKQINRVITDNYGSVWNGTDHNHHCLSLSEPSQGDVQQVMGVTRRNRFHNWHEWIITFPHQNQNNQLYRNRSPKIYTKDKHLVEIHAYHYTDPQNGVYERVPIRVLPGLSPLRLAIMHSGLLDPRDIVAEAQMFPLSWILYDKYTEHIEQKQSGCLESLSSQCEKLPEDMQQGITIDPKEDILEVSIQLSRNRILRLCYRWDVPLMITKASLEYGENTKSIDLMSRIEELGNEVTLNQVCEFADPLECDHDSEGKDETNSIQVEQTSHRKKATRRVKKAVKKWFSGSRLNEQA